jgi:hypothetical protein
MKAALLAVALVAFAYVVAADDPTVKLPGVSDLSEFPGTAHHRSAGSRSVPAARWWPREVYAISAVQTNQK